MKAAAALVLSATFVLAAAVPARAQLGALGKIKKGADQAAEAKKVHDEMTFSPAEERQIGEQVSAKLRQRFGVYQNQDVSKYVALVGTVIAQVSSKPALDWQFIVLDSDGVNAYAAPGGFIHVTRGLLGMLKDESELAGVLGHEITHVTERHTIDDLRTSSGIAEVGNQAGKGGGLSRELIAKLSAKAFEDIFNGQFSQAKESNADEIGARLANKVGYSPHGLATALQKILDRNTGQQQPNGWFSSHPALKDRISKVEKQIKSEKLTSTATVAPRYKQHITFDAKPLSDVPTVAGGASGLASGDKKKEDEPKQADTKKKGFGGLGSITGGKQQAQSGQQTASAGARGLGNDRDARGGTNPAIVAVKVTPEEITAFKKGIA
jgi:predicted Zn-dependent protease